MMNSDHAGEFARVSRTAARVRLAVVLGAAAVVMAVAAVAIGVAALLPERAVHQPGSWIPFILSLTAIAAGLLVALVARRYLLASSVPALIPEVERSIGLRRGQLAGALELATPTRGGSASLADLGRDRVAARLAQHEDWELFPESLRSLGRRISVSGVLFVVAIGGLAVLASRAPARAVRAAEALGQPWTTAFPPPPPRIRVAPGDTAVLRGDRLTVRAVAPLRDSVAVVWQAEGEPIRRLRVAVADSGTSRGAVATGQTGPIDAPTRYWVEDDAGRRSPIHEVTPLDPMLVTDLTVELRYPRYLGRPAETLGSLGGEIELPAGTLVRVRGRTNAPLRFAALTDSAGADTVAFEIEGPRFSAEWRPVRDGSWSWRLTPAGDLPGVRPPPPFTVRVVPDLAPGIEITYPARDTAAAVDLRLPLVVDARDDRGLATIDLETWRVSATGVRSEPAAVPLWEADAPAGRESRIVLRPVLRLDVLGLVPGDTLFYTARARDAHPGHGAVYSDTFRVFVPTMTELRRSAAESASDLARAGRELRDDAAELSRAARDAERRSADGSPGRRSESEASTDFGGTEEARRVLERGQGIEQRMKELRRQAEELREGAEDSGLADSSMREKLEELEELFRQIEETGLGEQLRRLEEALRNLDAPRTREALGELSSRLRELEERLDRTLSLMERVATEQTMKETATRTRQLAEQQAALSESYRADSAWAGRQADAEAEAERLAERMQELREKLTKHGLDAVADSVRQAADRLGEASERMEAAGNAARQGEQGQRSAAQAASQASEAAGAMQRAGQMLNEDWKQQALEAVSRATGEALDLAAEQDRLADAIEKTAKSAGGENPAAGDLAGRQAALAQGFDQMLQSLAEAGRKTALIDEQVGSAAADARARMQALGEALAARGGPPHAAADEARALVEALNTLAGRLMASRQAVQNAASATGMQEMLDQLAKMSQSQAGLNRESGGLMLMRQGGRPMTVQMRRLAERQAEIGRRLEELAARPEAEELPARPELLAAEADEIAADLRNGRLDEETMARQERLFRRLLDAGRSLERGEDPLRRESRAADMSAPVAIPETPVDVDAGPRYPYPDDEALTGVSRSARRLILDYFDRLNANPAAELAPESATGAGAGEAP